ncbi:response regulator [Candidatus Sulfurimonas marisnigri]|uniref:Sensor protein FixL n=1 Tax=Candidatus Sulfurimonas marisnigri TaxID=2740405 RepID=A0A7S7M1L1_9BACT|nr:response regulator [Candidatus Sulfurimonas marisnigri]QOY55250.1 response regulator [Candidatus Sulfurimonas marisnigri]
MHKERMTSIVNELKESLKDGDANSGFLDEIKAIWEDQHAHSVDDKERFRAVVDSVFEGIITIEPNGIVGSFNLAAEKIFGYEASEVIGKNIKMLMPEPYHSEHDGYLANFMQSGIAKIIGIGRDVEGRRKDGSTFPLYLAVTKIKDNNKPIFVGTVRDLSEQKRLEKFKNEFVSTVSHELRTPLTSIKGSLSLIDSGVMGEVGEKIKPLIQIALNNSERLILLINDILDMEKIESGKMDFYFEKANLNDLIHKAIEANIGYAKEFDVTLSFENQIETIQVYVDVNRMQQVLTNLISNAVKYSPKKDAVVLKVIVYNKRARVEIHDNGLGVPEEFKKRIFQQFAQADSSDTKLKGGTGLGLSITKSIVEKFGGSIGFLSPEGKGTTFFFYLPIVNEFDTEVQIQKGTRGKVLVVEDDHDIATLLRIMLSQEDIDCDIAYTAREATSLLKKNIYDAMTLDIMLPDQDGMSFLEEIRKEESLKNLAVIIVSARASNTKKESTEFELEVIDWINKPIDQKYLIQSLNNALHVKKIHQAKILHVEDDEDIAKLVKILLNELGHIDLAVDKAEAFFKLQDNKYDLILLDMMLPDGSGEEILSYMKDSLLEIPVVLFSAQEVNHALKAKVAKALVKSRTSNEYLVETIKNLLEENTKRR